MAQYTQEQYTALCAAISQGALQVKYGDKWIIYRSLAEMLQIKALMENDLYTGPKGNGRKVISYTKGLK